MALAKRLIPLALCLCLIFNSAEGARRRRKPQQAQPAVTAAPARPYIFRAPQGWRCVDEEEELPGLVAVLYIGAGKTGGFTPSMNLAVEETQLTLDAYTELAQSYHGEQAQTTVRSLGTLETRTGVARVLQIDRLTQWGEVRFLQAVVVSEGKAYVLTATSLKEEYVKYQPEFFQAIQSFTVNPEAAKKNS